MAAQILIVGNATVDETYAVPTLPVPGESVLGQCRARDVGGKGANVATLLARCGVPTQLTAALGDDERGKFVSNRLAQESITLDLQLCSTQATDVSIVYADAQGSNSIVTTTAAAFSLNSARVKAAIYRLNHGDVLVMQGNLTQALTLSTATMAQQAGITFVFNPSPYIPWMDKLVAMADIVFVNAEEARALTGLCDESAVQALLRQGACQVVLTRGERGVLMAGRRGNVPLVSCIPAEVVAPVVDTTGAGDTLLAVALASASLRGVKLDTIAMNHAVRAAAMTIGSHGTYSAFPDAEQLSLILAG
ncbi:MAG: PfkB family carbohydrate kinase [Granulosicoccus sp.]